MAWGSETEDAILEWQTLVKIEFPGNTILAWSGTGEITYNSEVYEGVGEFGSIRDISETSDLRAETLEISLSGLDTTLLAEAKDETHQGSAVTVSYAIMNPATGAIVNAETVFIGEVDTVSMRFEDTGATITLRVENALRALFRALSRTRNDQDQQQLHSGDKYFEYVHDVTGPINWGRRDQYQGPAGPNGAFSDGTFRQFTN